MRTMSTKHDPQRQNQHKSVKRSPKNINIKTIGSTGLKVRLMTQPPSLREASRFSSGASSITSSQKPQKHSAGKKTSKKRRFWNQKTCENLRPPQLKKTILSSSWEPGMQSLASLGRQAGRKRLIPEKKAFYHDFLNSRCLSKSRSLKAMNQVVKHPEESIFAHYGELMSINSGCGSESDSECEESETSKIQILADEDALIEAMTAKAE